MKAFVNVLIKTDSYDETDELADAVVHLVEEDGHEVLWYSAKEAK
jgi:hypothetical protein